VDNDPIRTKRRSAISPLRRIADTPIRESGTRRFHAGLPGGVDNAGKQLFYPEFRFDHGGTCWTAGAINPKDINQVQNWFKIDVKKIGVSARRGRRDRLRNFWEIRPGEIDG
jgi:hypothetical protein